MSIFEYDEELHMQQERAAAREDGREEERAQLFTVIRLMCEDGLTEDIPKLTTDAVFFHSMLDKYQL